MPPKNNRKCKNFRKIPENDEKIKKHKMHKNVKHMKTQIKTGNQPEKENSRNLSKKCTFGHFGLPCHLLTLNNLIRRLNILIFRTQLLSASSRKISPECLWIFSCFKMNKKHSKIQRFKKEINLKNLNEAARQPSTCTANELDVKFELRHSAIIYVCWLELVSCTWKLKNFCFIALAFFALLLLIDISYFFQRILQ